MGLVSERWRGRRINLLWTGVPSFREELGMKRGGVGGCEKRREVEMKGC
jgi:hypothetical protein